uniref:Uncharacterized protein n=1 Tax=Fagus sylvatica TaxID=28930 RepID=A0A2N9IFM9_FAGSY
MEEKEGSARMSGLRRRKPNEEFNFKIAFCGYNSMIPDSVVKWYAIVFLDQGSRPCYCPCRHCHCHCHWFFFGTEKGKGKRRPDQKFCLLLESCIMHKNRGHPPEFDTRYVNFLVLDIHVPDDDDDEYDDNDDDDEPVYHKLSVSVVSVQKHILGGA